MSIKKIFLPLFLLVFLTPLPAVACNQCSNGLKADSNCDGEINIQDFSLWRSKSSEADFDCDGKVDLVDFSLWREALNYTSPTTPPSQHSQKYFATLVKEDKIAFTIDDDNNRLSPLINHAFTFLALKDQNDQEFYHQNLLALAQEDYQFFDGAPRQIADLMESYLLMKDIFPNQEKEIIENWFLRETKRIQNSPGIRFQGAGANMAATATYLALKSDFENIRAQSKDLEKYAQTGFSFDSGWSPAENSAHYSAYLMMSALRVALYTNQGQILKSQTGLENLRNLAHWLISINPHNGHQPAFGATYERDSLRPWFNTLVAASYLLKNYDPLLAQNCKWMAQTMFDWALSHNQEKEWANHPAGRFEANPLWIYQYWDDQMPATAPNLNNFDSLVISRDFCPKDAGWDNTISQRQPQTDKIILRTGWEQNDLFIQVETAPQTGKSKPWAGNINQIVFGNQPILTGFAKGGNNWEDSWWAHLNVAEPPSSSWKAQISHFENNHEQSTVTLTNSGWTRKLALNKKEKTLLVQDKLSRNGKVHWHFQGNLTILNSHEAILEKEEEKIKLSWQADKAILKESDKVWWGHTGNQDQQLTLRGKNVSLFLERLP